MNSTRTIVFYIPEALRGVGGVQNLVVNLAKEFESGDYANIEVIIYCPRSSFVANEVASLAGARIKVRFWSVDSAKIPSNSLLVLWAGFNTVARFRNSNPFVLLWSVAPGQPFGHFEAASRKFSPVKRYLARRLISTARLLVENNGVACMDRENLHAMRNAADLAADIPFLPIALPIGANRFAQFADVTRSTRPLRVAWIGRGSTDWKIIPLVRFLQEAHWPRNGVALTIFTDEKQRYEQLLGALNLPMLSVDYRVGVSGEKLRNELSAGCDLNLGMGLSLLEGASVGVPSVFVAPQTDPKRLPFWQWVFERGDGDFGHAEWKIECSGPFDLAGYAANPATWPQLSTQSYEYVAAHHSPQKVAKMLSSWKSEVRLKSYLKAHGCLFELARLLSRSRG